MCNWQGKMDRRQRNTAVRQLGLELMQKEWSQSWLVNIWDQIIFCPGRGVKELVLCIVGCLLASWPLPLNVKSNPSNDITKKKSPVTMNAPHLGTISLMKKLQTELSGTKARQWGRQILLRLLGVSWNPVGWGAQRYTEGNTASLGPHTVAASFLVQKWMVIRLLYLV